MSINITSLLKCVQNMYKKEANQKCKRNVKKYTVNIKMVKSL